MNKINYCLVIYFSFVLLGCAQQNDFKYKGELPKEKYQITEISSNDIQYLDGDSVAIRNRIYIDLNSDGSLYLNNHLVTIEDFSSSYEYIFTNPDRLSHLPESTEETVLFTNLLDQMSDVNMNGRGFQIAYIMSKLNNVNIDLMYDNLFERYGAGWIKISQEEIERVQQRFTPKVAIIAPDRGVSSLLPPWADEEDIGNVKERSVLSVKVNDKNELLVREEVMEINQLRALTRAFIKNPNQKEDYAESPQKAIISLTNDQGTDYKTYIDVYNELKGAYEELWEEESQARFGKSYKEVNREEKKIIRTAIPFVLSEAEPTNFDDEND